MRLFKTLLAPACAILAVLLWMKGYALANGTAPAADGGATWKQYLPEIVMAGCALLSWFSRYATNINFFHTAGGTLLLAFIAAAATGGTQLATAGTLAAPLVVKMLLAALFTALGMNNPSMQGKPTDPASGTKIGAVMLLPFLLVGAVVLSSCAHSTPNPPKPPTDPSLQQKYEAAFGRCMEQRGITVAGDDFKKVFAILTDSTLTSAQKTKALEDLGISTGIGGLTDTGDCALVAWEQVDPLMPGGQPNSSQAAVRVVRARHPKPTTSSKG